MTGGRCAYPPCPNTRNNRPGLRFHRFPVNKEVAMQWAINCQSPELIDVVLQGYKIYTNKRLCSEHFERPCFMNDLRLSLTKLAVPTIFTKKNTETTSDSSSNNVTKLDTTCEHTTEEVQQLNSNKHKVHFTLAEIIAETVGLDKSQSSDVFFYDDEDVSQLFSEINPTEGSEEFHAADTDLPQLDPNADPSESTQALYQNNKTTVSTVTSSASKKLSPTKTVPPMKERTTVMSLAGDASKELLCRLCANLVCVSEMVHIFGKSSASKGYLQKINQLLPFSEQPAENDLLPKWICQVCCERLNYCDQAIRDFISASVKINRLLSTKLSKRHRALTETESTSVSPNPRSATRPTNDESVEDDPVVIKEEHLDDEQFQERLPVLNLTDCSTKQQRTHVTDFTTVQQVQDRSMPHSSQKGDCMKLCSTNSVLADHSYHCTCLQCVDTFSHNCSRVNTAKTEMNIVKKPQTITMTEPLDSQDCSSSESVVHEKCPVKRKSHQLDTNDVRSTTSVSSSPKFVKLEGVDRVDNSKASRSVVVNKNHLFSSTSCSWSKKLKQVSGQEESQGKRIQSSHTVIPTASDNKTFVCEKCDMSFSSIETALTHRFKEHPEEILCTQGK